MPYDFETDPPLKLTDPMPWGRHVGELIGTIIEEDDGAYIFGCINNMDNIEFDEEVHDYVEEAYKNRFR